MISGADAAACHSTPPRFGASRRARCCGCAAHREDRRRDGPAQARSWQRPLSASLETFASDGAPIRRPILAAEAARGFSAGNGYLTGLVVDRFA